MTGAGYPDPLDGPAVQAVDQRICDALDALGITSEQVADSLAAHPAVAGSFYDDDPVCVYLQCQLDEAAAQVLHCDVATLTFAVINPDGLTWTQATTVLPAPVRMFCLRADQGDFPELVEART